ncbi:uncharacterized protein HMPREF1541_05904 [Cyphellophora europaea CBS 101466]|uniref:Uncharacterized protein n=1 Tax=Cyphellophora europaea (strain CBS 101466) TaxID=1220924 RepID=W2RV73_CYPE1|nr:uncharacterized protein HMPREF1541_05904 [Cyphellophora europaea CBS 101466]ETN39678.1 hypothetical protein HMPREF1541_05904 [Cyphellophora europaea CBS 101466]
MCHLLPYASHTCPHRWVVLAVPCAPNLTFASAPPGHRFTRPTTLLGSTQWYPAAPRTCPDCDLHGNYNGDKMRMYLGKGMAGERAGRAGLWGPYGNGFWGGRTVTEGCAGYGATGYVPGVLAVEGQGGYSLRGDWIGAGAGAGAGGYVRPPRKTPGRWPGQGFLGCFGI